MITWRLEKSFIFNLAPTWIFNDIPELRRAIQAIADTSEFKVGELKFKYELDEQEQPNVVHVSFINSEGRIRRFMRFRRIDQRAAG
jgi:hypothetical protein